MDYSTTLETRIREAVKATDHRLDREHLITQITNNWYLAPFKFHNEPEQEFEKRKNQLPYLKKDQVVLLKETLANCHTSVRELDNYFYNLTNKEPLKRVAYGALNYKDNDVNLMRNLMAWEGAYFLSGLFQQKASRNIENPSARQTYENQLRHQNTYAIVLETIKHGIRHLMKVHGNIDGKYHDKQYAHLSPELPYAEGLSALIMPKKMKFWPKPSLPPSATEKREPPQQQTLFPMTYMDDNIDPKKRR